MHTSNDWRHEQKHEENLRLKLRREFPEEIVDECKTYGQLEAKKAILESFKSDKPCRSTQERAALKFEAEAHGDDEEDSLAE